MIFYAQYLICVHSKCFTANAMQHKFGVIVRELADPPHNLGRRTPSHELCCMQSPSETTLKTPEILGGGLVCHQQCKTDPFGSMKLTHR